MFPPRGIFKLLGIAMRAVNSSSASAHQLSADAVFSVGGFSLVCLVLFAAILVLNDLRFTYTLDDPYIHLAVAEEIARGGYGVNVGEFSSPSSSVIWPLLLAPFARFSAGEFAPLVLNLACGVVVTLAFLRLVRRLLPPENDAPGVRAPLLRAGLVWLALLACNVPGIVFTGMEHTLQVLAAVVVAEGMFRFAKDGTAGKWWIAAIIAGPLVRYENLALSAAACALLFFHGRKNLAIGAGVAALAGVAAFSGFLVALGLPLMPSSVIVKSHFTGEEGNRLVVLWEAASRCVKEGRGTLMLVLALAVAWLGCRAWNGGKFRTASLALLGAAVLHGCFGSFGWLNRYECYIYAALLTALAALAVEFSPRGAPLGRRADAAFAAVALLFTGFPYITELRLVPVAANNVYDQQYQMHRFLTGWWKRPAAVNDLGWPSYRNDHYVLDLWGLGNHEAYLHRCGEDTRWMVPMVGKHGVDLAIVFEKFLPVYESGWVKVGEMTLSRESVILPETTVVFFATRPEAAPEIVTQLEDFRPTLPPGVSMKITSLVTEREK